MVGCRAPAPASRAARIFVTHLPFPELKRLLLSSSWRDAGAEALLHALLCHMCGPESAASGLGDAEQAKCSVLARDREVRCRGVSRVS
jgi:hypothetical protein